MARCPQTHPDVHRYNRIPERVANKIPERMTNKTDPYHQMIQQNHKKMNTPQHIYLESHVLGSESLKCVYNVLAVDRLSLTVRAVDPAAVQ